MCLSCSEEWDSSMCQESIKELTLPSIIRHPSYPKTRSAYSAVSINIIRQR